MDISPMEKKYLILNFVRTLLYNYRTNIMKKIRLVFLCISLSFIFFPAFTQTIGSKVSFPGTDGKTYTGAIKNIRGDKYLIKYDGYDFEAWVVREQFTVVNTPNTNYSNTEIQNTQQSNGNYQVGQKVEAFNVIWYKATVIGFGSGDLAGYIKVHYDEYSSSSDQYLKASSIRIQKNTATPNFSGGPRNGRYTILSYGNIYNPITLGYFNLNNGSYTYYDAAKKPIGRGTYLYDANSKEVKWQSGPLRDYGPSAGFEIDREGKTHKLRLKYSTIGTNSTDS